MRKYLFVLLSLLCLLPGCSRRDGNPVQENRGAENGKAAQDVRPIKLSLWHIMNYEGPR